MPRPAAPGHAGPPQPAAQRNPPASTAHLGEAEAAAPPVLTIYRIYYRKPKTKTRWASHETELVAGEAERDRLLARPRPKAVFCEAAVIHECSTCGDRRPWDDGWRWFGCPDDIEDKIPIRRFCSDLCRPVECENAPRPEGATYREWPRLSQFEPDLAGDLANRWLILREIDDPTAHRKVPMPDWPGPGKCRWCLEPTVYESGKKIGQPAARNWHNACYYQYRLHTELAAQHDFLLDRDGPRCQICGDGGWKAGIELTARPEGMTWAAFYSADKTDFGRYTVLEPVIALQVDHVIPLWKVVLLWPGRRDLYGPVNLWLLCDDCHKAKSAVEAAERAAVKRST